DVSLRLPATDRARAHVRRLRRPGARGVGRRSARTGCVVETRGEADLAARAAGPTTRATAARLASPWPRAQGPVTMNLRVIFVLSSLAAVALACGKSTPPSTPPDGGSAAASPTTTPPSNSGSAA